MFCSKCGQEVADNQKFCHKCGQPMPLAQQQPQGYASVDPRTVNMPVQMPGAAVPMQGNPYPVAVNGGDGQPIETVNAEVVPNGYQGGNPQPYGYGQQPMQQAMPQININVAQQQETTVVHETTIIKSQEEDSGWLFGEIGLIGIGIWIASTWWIALISCIVLCILVMIPVIGHVICVALGAGVGVIAWVIAKAFDAPNGAAIFLGIIFGLGAIIWNLQDRKTLTED